MASAKTFSESRLGSGFLFSVFCMSAAFITYCSMYAFRKPFTAGVYEDMQIGGIDYKIILITAQVLGYMVSKFAGIKIISEMDAAKRVVTILGLMGFSWLSLLLFGLTPYPYNFIWMFFNGLPLGMIWGLVFSFLEGRRNTELLGAGMCVSFIVASGLVKSVGKFLIESFSVSEFWMPFMTGLIFVPFLLLGVWMLTKIPPPTAEDISHRTERVPMGKTQRRAFFRAFAPGIVLMVAVYIALTIFRDVRDNFAVEIWALLGFAGSSQVLLTAEIPIGISVFLLIALAIFIPNNRIAFYLNLGIIMTGGILLIVMTLLYENKMLNPAVWMIGVGFAMYLSYVSFHTLLFERWIALFRHPSNIGFLMYIADAFGYLGSVGILFIKNFSNSSLNWLSYTVYLSYLIGGITLVLSLLAVGYFWRKEGKGFLRRKVLPSV